MGCAVAIPAGASTRPAATIPPATLHAARMTVSPYFCRPDPLVNRSEHAKCFQLFLSVLCGSNGRAPVLVQSTAGAGVRRRRLRPPRHAAHAFADRTLP